MQSLMQSLMPSLMPSLMQSLMQSSPGAHRQTGCRGGDAAVGHAAGQVPAAALLRRTRAG